MDESHRWLWVRAVFLTGALYCFVGIVFAGHGPHVRAWRLAAWAVSAAAWAAHVAYERFVLRSSSHSGALHAALAVALGAFGLAVAANIHSLAVASTQRHRGLLLLSLMIWPVLAGLPAWLASLAASWALALLRERARPKERP